MKLLLSAALLLSFAIPATAQDAARGEKEFNKCKSCHSITTPEGETIVRGGKTGPDLHGVIGRTAGSTDFRYGASMKSLADKGVVWSEDELVVFLSNPKEWLVTQTGDSGAKTTMTFKLVKGGADVAAYLASVAQ